MLLYYVHQNRAVNPPVNNEQVLDFLESSFECLLKFWMGQYPGSIQEVFFGLDKVGS